MKRKPRVAEHVGQEAFERRWTKRLSVLADSEAISRARDRVVEEVRKWGSTMPEGWKPISALMPLYRAFRALERLEKREKATAK